MQGTSSSRTAGKQQDRDPFPAVTFIGRRLAALVITGVSLLIFTMPSCLLSPKRLRCSPTSALALAATSIQEIPWVMRLIAIDTLRATRSLQLRAALYGRFGLP